MHWWRRCNVSRRLPKARRVGGVTCSSAKARGQRNSFERDISESVYGTLKLGTFAIRKVYCSIHSGTEHLSETFAEVLESERSMPLELIDVAVKLDHYRGFPVRETGVTLAVPAQECVHIFGFTRLGVDEVLSLSCRLQNSPENVKYVEHFSERAATYHEAGTWQNGLSSTE